MRQRDLFALVNDPRITPDALRVVMHLASRGVDQWHEVAFDEFAELLEEAGEKRIHKAIERADRCGYLEFEARRGRGQHYRFRASLTPRAENPSPGGVLSENPAPSGVLEPENPSPGGVLGGGYIRGGNSSQVVSLFGTRAVTSSKQLEEAGARSEEGTAPATAAEPLERDQIIRLAIRLANKGLDSNPAVPAAVFRPIVESGPSYAIVSEWLDKGVEWPAIRAAVWETAQAYQPNGRNRSVSTMKYFEGPVFDEHAKAVARQLDAPASRAGSSETPAAPHTPSGTPTPKSHLDESLARWEAEQRARFEAASASWKQPAAQGI